MKTFIKRKLPLKRIQNLLGISYHGSHIANLQQRVARIEGMLEIVNEQSQAEEFVYQINLDYPIKPVPRYGYGSPPNPYLYEIINRRRDKYLIHLNSILSLRDNFFQIPVNIDSQSTEPNWFNGLMPALDGMSLYYFLWKNKPRFYIEIGSGVSTKFARKAIKDQKLPTKIISIDPKPRAEIDKLCDQVIRQPLEDANLEIFDRLEEKDILFVDGSHRCFMNSDVSVVFLDILPRLKSGVFLEFHDILLPYDYPPSYAHLHYSEQYLLAAYLLADGNKIEVLLPNIFISNDAELNQILDPLWSDAQMAGAEKHGCSFWLKTL